MPAGRRSSNALVDDPDWCGHPFVSLRDWACADCGRQVTPATRRRLEAEPTAAPPGRLWVLLVSWNNDDSIDERECSGLDGIFSDRAKIGRLMIRGRILDADDLRDIMRRTHWYQGAFAPSLFEGWAEEPDSRGCYHLYRLSLEKIDSV